MWFTDGFGDYVRHFMIAMGAVPEWAPPGESHLLRSTSVVQGVTYGAGRIDYRTFDASAQEVLRLAFVPATVTAGQAALPQRTDLSQPGWTFDAATGVLRVRHDGAADVSITGSPAPPGGADGGSSPGAPTSGCGCASGATGLDATSLALAALLLRRRRENASRADAPLREARAPGPSP